MPDYVTPTGLTIPTVESLLTTIGDKLRATIDPLLDTDPDSPQGQFNGIFASHLREAWEVIGLAFNGLDPDQAEGSLLENVSAITGTIRNGATASLFDGTHKVSINVDANKVLPGDGSIVFSQAGNPTVRFGLTEALDTTGAGGAANYLVSAECQTLGPVSCNAGTLTVIATPFTGLNSVTNPFDADPGKLTDLDPVLRLRREQELRATGAGTVDSLKADVLAILYNGSNPVQTCKVFENETDLLDANGLPPHSLEVLLFDGVSAPLPANTIAQTIWNSKPGGIKLIGNTTGTAKDGNGDSQTVAFSRPLLLEVNFLIQLVINSKYAGDQAVKDAINSRFKEMVRTGYVIRYNDYVSALIDDNGRGVPGVVDVPSITLGVVGGIVEPANTNLPLEAREMAFTQDSDITLQPPIIV